MTDQERVTIRTGSRTYATGILQWRDAEKATAVIKVNNKIISGQEIKKDQPND